MFSSGLPGWLAASLVAGAVVVCAQPGLADSLPRTPQPAPQPAPQAAAVNAPSPAAGAITLSQAIALALKNDPAYAGALAASGSARLDAALSRSALLPNADAHGQYLYTQPNGVRNQAGQIGSQAAPRFIANNAIREYAAQVLVNESLSFASFAGYQRARGLAAQSAADLESARRDLVVRVVAAYFGVLSASEKEKVAQRALTEAQTFLDLTQKLESGREVAHADVVKADLSDQQRQRELGDATLAAEKARLDLGVLLFPDPRTPYSLVAAGQIPDPLPDRATTEAESGKNNPDLRSALAALHAAHSEVFAARAGYFPALALNYSWGIDAPQFAVNGPDGVRNLGYSASVGLDIPLWDWFATHDRVRQSELREHAAQAALTTVQRTLIAQLDEFYSEARVASDQVASFQTSVDTARESLRLTRLRYSAGEALALEVVDAENALAQAESALADGRLRAQVARANLQTLTGVL
ncbi:MAG TPA: TolC family protein [Acidobacteriaceae bacterium]|jgi:outer membrane protein TolC|nr:TolC family protein [Acidobacteriaceae bacterium]